MLLYFFDGENIEFGIMCSVFASIGFSGSLVFYNAFLPEIVTNKDGVQTKVSSVIEGTQSEVDETIKEIVTEAKEN